MKQETAIYFVYFSVGKFHKGIFYYEIFFTCDLKNKTVETVCFLIEASVQKFEIKCSSI
jgi:hypothetical protein